MDTPTIFFYIMYLTITVFITVRVGWLCYTHGEHYIREILNDKPQLVKPLNNLLLTGYYLVNIGYVVIVLSTTVPQPTIAGAISELSHRIGIIILTLGLMHYFNIFAIAQLSRYIRKDNFNHKPLNL